MANLSVVVGGQFGSEAKGHVTRQVIDKSLTQQAADILNIRVAGPNAGHVAYDERGNRWALRQVPVGGTNPDLRVQLHIAAGSEVDPAVLVDEIMQMDAAGLRVSERLTVSPEATVLTPEHKYRESAARMHENIGSTGKGIGAARADRLMRTAMRVQDDPILLETLAELGVPVQEPLRGGDGGFGHIVIEGTQGYGLGLHAGHYPQCTSSDTRAIDFLAMAGISPWVSWVQDFEVWVVARVYPIRVAGNSGRLHDETSWEDLGLPEERTTVTNKVRRVGQWDADLVRWAVLSNGGTPVVRVALTMADQKFDWVGGKAGDYYDQMADVRHEDLVEIEDFLSNIEGDAGAPVRMITTSPTTAMWVDPII